MRACDACSWIHVRIRIRHAYMLALAIKNRTRKLTRIAYARVECARAFAHGVLSPFAHPPTCLWIAGDMVHYF